MAFVPSVLPRSACSEAAAPKLAPPRPAGAGARPASAADASSEPLAGASWSGASLRLLAVAAAARAAAVCGGAARRRHGLRPAAALRAKAGQDHFAPVLVSVEPTDIEWDIPEGALCLQQPAERPFASTSTPLGRRGKKDVAGEPTLARQAIDVLKILEVLATLCLYCCVLHDCFQILTSEVHPDKHHTMVLLCSVLCLRRKPKKH